jgi:hypothetical protein
MGLLDKVKAQAEQVAAKAQQGVSQGQAKLDAMQAKKQGDALLRDLGAAYFAQQRSGGSADAVAEALAKVDAHIAEHGAVDTAPTMPKQSSSSPGETGDSGASYNLDDM